MRALPNFYKLELHRYDPFGYDILSSYPLDVRIGYLYSPIGQHQWAEVSRPYADVYYHW
jgi:hypothetical protein